MSGNYFKELMSKQIKNVHTTKKLSYNDLKRIAKYISSSIFDENTCCLWNGYITNSNNKNKGTYINFYFRQKKVALHRLLYINFIGDLTNEEYLKFSCPNKGKCCNIHHMQKFHYEKVSIGSVSVAESTGNNSGNKEIDADNIKKTEIVKKKEINFYVDFD